MSGQSVRDLSENSKVQMAEVVAGLIAGHSLRVIAETTKVPAARIRRWVVEEDEVFMALLRDVEETVVEHLQDEMIATVAAAIDRLTPKAIDALEEAIDAGTVSQKTTAAAHILRFAGYGRLARDGSPALPAEELIRGAGAAAPDPATGD